MENNQNPTILVLAASGTPGKQVVKELESKPVDVCHSEVREIPDHFA